MISIGTFILGGMAVFFFAFGVYMTVNTVSNRATDLEIKIVHTNQFLGAAYLAISAAFLIAACK